jgi:hypothetical protein
MPCARSMVFPGKCAVGGFPGFISLAKATERSQSGLSKWKTPLPPSPCAGKNGRLTGVAPPGLYSRRCPAPAVVFFLPVSGPETEGWVTNGRRRGFPRRPGSIPSWMY